MGDSQELETAIVKFYNDIKGFGIAYIIGQDDQRTGETLKFHVAQMWDTDSRDSTGTITCSRRQIPLDGSQLVINPGDRLWFRRRGRTARPEALGWCLEADWSRQQ